MVYASCVSVFGCAPLSAANQKGVIEFRKARYEEKPHPARMGGWAGPPPVLGNLGQEAAPPPTRHCNLPSLRAAAGGGPFPPGVPAENPDEWGWHGVRWHGVCMGLAWGWHGVGMGLAWGWHGVSMGLALACRAAWRVGLAWGWHGVGMGSAN
jgi:hypothetical protein